MVREDRVEYIDASIAKLALKHAREGVKVNKYAEVVKGFPAMVITGTILGAIAFAEEKSKGKSDTAQAYGKLIEHIRELWREFYDGESIKEDTLLTDVLLTYQENVDGLLKIFVLQELTLKYLSYLRRYATAFEEAKGNGQRS